MNVRWLGSVAAAALAFGFGAPAWAQDAGSDVTEVEELVVTGSQVELPRPAAGGQVAQGSRVGLFGALDVLDTPFSTTAYTEDLIRLQQARSVGDVLLNDPTVRVAKGFGNFQELYVVRGFPVYSDDMTYNGIYGILPRQFVAAELLERVEVFRGATAFLNGAAPGGSAVGGAFNLVPKRAGEDPLTRLTAGVESGGQLYGALDLGRRFGVAGDFGARLNLVHRDGETSVDGQERELSVIGLGLDGRGARYRFTADVGYQDNRIEAPRPSVTPLGEVPEPPSADGNFAQPWTYTDEKQLFGVARGEVDLTRNVVAWAAVGGRRGEEANVLANPNAAADGSLTAYRFDNAREDHILSADAGVRAEFDTGPVEHRLVLSGSRIELDSENAYAFSSFFAPFATDLYAPVDVAPPAADFFVGGDLSDPLTTEKLENGSVALADMLSFLDGRVLATVGVRWQEIDTRSFDYNTGAELSGYRSDAVTPAFALVYKPSDSVSLYANYAEALIPGAIAPASSGGAPVTNAGEVLEPFRGEQMEGGVKLDQGAYGGTLSVFEVTLPSAFVENGVFGTNGERRSRGAELTVFGEPAEGLRILGGATLIDAEFTRTEGGTLDGKSVIGVPEFTANLNVEYDVAALDGLTVEGRVVHTGDQPVDAANTVDLDAWTRLDLGARYGFEAQGRPLELRARVENVTDEDYWASVGGFPGANYLVLGTPRTFVLSVAAEF